MLADDLHVEGDARARAASDAEGDGATTAPPQLPIARRGDRPVPRSFLQGTHPPYAIRWFGVTSLFGHLRHFAASAIASEQVDARDWMRPLDPDEILARVVAVLAPEASARRPRSVAEALGRPVWIDFIADTGDDHDVSVAVGEMLFAEYTFSDGGPARALPRGDILLMGGDTAYPVATAQEIEQRLVAPWSEVLARLEPTRRRALLAIPGNHDWYDGLDGFARIFRRSAIDEAADGRPSSASAPRGSTGGRGRRRRTRGVVARQLHLDELGGLLRLARDAARSVRAFFRGSTVPRKKRLELEGYEPVQEASYWALALAPGIEAWGVDRQLRKIDFRQRAFFAARRAAADRGRILFVAPDPSVAFEERHDLGAQMLTACELDLEADRVFYLCGDVHHYERRKVNASVHVVAGGGGAFSHGTRVGPRAKRPVGGPTAATFPTPSTSRRLVVHVPWKLMVGKAGFLAHIAAAIVAAIELGADAEGPRAFAATSLIVTGLLVLLLYMVAGHAPRHARAVSALCVPFGATLGLLPVALKLALHRVPRLTGDGVVIVVYAFAGALVFGLFLTVLALLGLEHQQAFSVLGHSGFKHFVRMCVHPGGKVEAWVIGKDDPLAKGAPVVIDDFVWGGDP